MPNPGWYHGGSAGHWTGGAFFFRKGLNRLVHDGSCSIVIFDAMFHLVVWIWEHVEHEKARERERERQHLLSPIRLIQFLSLHFFLKFWMLPFLDDAIWWQTVGCTDHAFFSATPRVAVLKEIISSPEAVFLCRSWWREWGRSSIASVNHLNHPLVHEMYEIMRIMGWANMMKTYTTYQVLHNWTAISGINYFDYMRHFYYFV